MKVFGGGLLIAVGLLLAGGSGLCSLMVLFSSGEMSGFGMWPLVLMFGGIPFALGVGLILGGRALIRSERRDVVDPGDTFE
jgi:hypothetical protein